MSKNCLKFCLVLLNIFFNFFIIKFVLLFFSPALAATINTPKQQQLHKEIQQIKSELNKALEESDSHEASVIIQPSWTLKAEQNKTSEKNKVEVTNQNRQEAAALRAEISQAVAKDQYATKGVTKTKDIKELQASLELKSQGEQLLKTVLGSAIDTPAADFLGSSALEQLETEHTKPNIVYAHPVEDIEIDIRKLQRLELNKRRTHEVLILNYIEEDLSFDLGYEVQEWQHIVQAGQEYFIGRRATDLLIVNKQADTYREVMKLDVGQTISCLETYTYWSLEQEQQEAVILLATQDKVLWYQANHTKHQLDLYWLWHIGQNVTSLTYFALDNHDYLIINTHQNALNIYQFDLSKKEFWLAQRMQLQSPCDEVCVLNTGRDVVLAIPQNNTASIYTFNPHESTLSQLYFQFKKTIAAQGIRTIAGFKMAGHSFLALSGYQPQILLYQQGDFISKTILGSNFGLVELFFPVPINTYRDDLLLLVQHRVDFSTHAVTVAETLIWNGDTFETSIPVPCRIGQQVVHGVTCMLDSHREEGVKGASLISRAEEISIIVPRQAAESGLFRFHTELLPKNSELKDLQEMFAFLKDWVKEQDDLVQQAEAFLQQPDQVLQNAEADFSTLETLKTPEFSFSGQVAEIYVNDYKWLKEDSDIDLDWLIQNIEELDAILNNVRPRRNLNAEVYHESLEVDELLVDHLEVENVNGQTFFIQNGQLVFEGEVEFRDLENITQQKEFHKRQLNEEVFKLEGDIQFDTINEVKWSDIRDNLVFKTEKQKLEDVEVAGGIIMESKLNITTLNALNFPGDYLLSSGPAATVVEAEKQFVKTLKANSVVTEGLINGKDPRDAITLRDKQLWLGMPTFKQLEVNEILELNSQNQERNMESLPQNPTLKEANIIEASCYFNELYVNGPLVLRGQLDNESLGLKLKDVILQPTNPLEEIVVTSAKNFAEVAWPIDFQLENNSINHIPLEDFVTAHTKQELNIESLEGYVYFYNLSLKGFYDGIKIEQLLKEIILLNKPVDLTSTELIFSEQLKADNLNIQEILNGKEIKNNLQTLQEDLIVKSAEFELLQGLQAHFLSDITGKGSLSTKDKTSKRRDNVFLNELILDKGLQTDELHGIKTEFLFEFFNKIVELPEMTLNGQIQVDHIFITGDIQLNKLNNLNFDEDLQLTTIWLNKTNYLSNELIFKNRLHVTGPLNVVGHYRGLYLPDVIDDIIVRKPNATIEITAPKSFLKPVKVLRNTQIKALNGILMENIAWKGQHNTFKGSLNIKGNLWARHIKVQGNINEFNWQEMADLLYYDKHLQKFILKDLIEFKQNLYLNDLTVLGDLNDIPDLTDFFNNLIYKNGFCLLKGKNTFTGRVSIERGAYIKHLNGHDLIELFNNLVFIHGFEPVVIQAPVIFEDVVKANEIQIKNSLELKDLNECSLREWLNNTLRVDRDLHIKSPIEFAAGCLDGKSLSVDFLNDVDLKRILTLNTPQTFNDTIKFSEIHLQGFIKSKGPVNKIDLAWHYNNTLMTYGNQHVFTPLNIHKIIVLKDLIIKGSVNGNKNLLQDVVTLQEDIVLTSPVYFQQLYAAQVITNDSVTGLDLEIWFSQAVKYQDIKPQYINGNWSVKNLKVKADIQKFGFKPGQYYAYTRTASSEHKYYAEKICQQIKEIRNKIRNKSLGFKYLEEAYDLNLQTEFKNFSKTLRNVFLLKANTGTVLLLLNFDCDTSVYEWLPALNKFVFKNSFSSGPIDHIEMLPFKQELNSSVEFITSYSSTEDFNCTLKPKSIWSVVKNETLRLKRNMTLELAAQIFKLHHYNSTLWSLNNETLKENNLDTDYRFVNYKQEGFVFEDSKPYLTDLLLALKQTLSQQVNITQLSIPETDLFDEDLVSDFMLLKEELQLQTVFPTNVFNISLAKLKVPENPAQVLAARVVKISWLVVKEIKEIPAHVYHNNDHDLLASLSKSLAVLIQDILKIAYAETAEMNNQLLNSVIERIRQFETELQGYLKALQENKVQLDIGRLSANQEYPGYNQQGEVLALQVGSTLEPLNLWAVSLTQSSMVLLNDTPGIYIYLQATYEKHLYQVLNANKPRSLQQLRVKQETFLMFIENCCQVQVLRYQGCQGFVKFAEIQSQEYVKHIKAIELPTNRKGGFSNKYYLVLALAKHLKFYEFVQETEIWELLLSQLQIPKECV